MRGVLQGCVLEALMVWMDAKDTNDVGQESILASPVISRTLGKMF